MNKLYINEAGTVGFHKDWQLKDLKGNPIDCVEDGSVVEMDCEDIYSMFEPDGPPEETNTTPSYTRYMQEGTIKCPGRDPVSVTFFFTVDKTDLLTMDEISMKDYIVAVLSRTGEVIANT